MNELQYGRDLTVPEFDQSEPVRPRIVAVNRFYWPDESATSQLLTDLMGNLADDGWRDLTVITSRMHYDDPDKRLVKGELRNGVRIRRVWSARHLWRRLRGRLLEYLSFYLSALIALMLEVRRDNIVVITTDPPLFSVLASIAVRVKRAHLVTWNHDLYPEVATAVGVPLARGRLAKFMRNRRNAVLRSAAENVVISPAMAKHVERELGASGQKIIVRNWCDSEIRPIPHAKNPLRASWGLRDDFVIGYSGNFGRAHIPGQVVSLVERCLDVAGLRWLFIGGGIGLDQLREVAARAPGIIEFRPYQDREDLSQSLSVPDLHLVSLDPSCEGLIYPSKLYGIMAAGRPTLFLGDPKSEVSADLARQRIGITLDVNAPESWRARVVEAIADLSLLEQMGARARANHQFIAQRSSLLAWRAVLSTADPKTVAAGTNSVRVE